MSRRVVTLVVASIGLLAGVASGEVQRINHDRAQSDGLREAPAYYE